MSNIREIAREKAAFYREAILKYQCMKKPCLIMFAVYMVGMFAILKSDFNYRDDLRRILSGKQGDKDKNTIVSFQLLRNHSL